MKRLSELTDLEVYSLTKEEEDMVVKIECMERGVKFGMRIPEQASRVKIAAPEIKCYKIHPFDIAVMDIDDARDIVEVIANSGDVRIMEYDYALSDFIAKKKVDKVMIKEAYMFKDSEVERMKAAMDKEIDEDYAKVVNEYKENRKIELDVTQEVLKEIYERQKKMRGFVEIKDIFYKEYLPLADGDMDKAMAFLKKAHNVSEELETFINTNKED